MEEDEGLTEEQHRVIRAAEAFFHAPTSAAMNELFAAVKDYQAKRAKELEIV